MNLIINFSAREKGNCGAIAEFIKKRGDMVIHYKNLHTHRCSDCEYECMQGKCKYREDDVYTLYESFFKYDRIIMIVPMYSRNPSSLYFSFNERCQDFFMENKEIYDDMLRRIFLIGVYGSRLETPDFVPCLEKWFVDTSYKNHVLGIERRPYKQKMKDCILDVEEVRETVGRFMERVEKNTEVCTEQFEN